ncbi:MAG TPA: carboxypeptidase-like regulatory domain-containing protein [Bryobacteraceae bacterium]|nr:carboxypeptidase-like regulatory domain-containing protein [Bryobacteraceae bacterium]
MRTAGMPLRVAFALLTTATFQSFAQSQTPPPSDCSVDGSVVNSITGEPVPRAHVIAMPAQASAIADSSGRWSLSNVPCGRVQIMAMRPGYLNSMGAPGPGMPRPLVTLSSGAPAHDMKIPLTPQAVVMGKVVDTQGDPIMGAQVLAMASRVVEGRRMFQTSNSMNTNDLGDYRIPSLPGGRYIICARPPANLGMPQPGGGGLQGGAESCYPGPVEAGPASAMEITPGRETRVDFTIAETSAVHVRGVISGMPKNMRAGLTLMKRGLSRGGGAPHAARISPDGKFDIPGVTPGSYLLMTDYWEAGQRLSARVPVDVGGSDVEGIDVQLEPGFNVTGTVRIESQSGRTLPQQQFGLSLRAPEPQPGSGQVKWNGDRSRFTINDVMPGTYRLEVFLPPPFYLKSATLGGRDIARAEIPIAQAAGPIDVALSDDSGSIEGQAEDSNGQPAASWIMALGEGRAARTALSGPDGHFKMDGLPPGDYRVYAWDDGREVEYADPDWMKQHGSGVTVTVQAGQSQQLKLTQQPSQ